MVALRSAILLAMAVAVIDAARVPQPLYNKQTKTSGGQSTNVKNSVPLPGEWVNINLKTNPVVTVSAGEVLELECEAVGSPPPSIKWSHGKNSLAEAGFSIQNEVINTAIGKVRSRLIIDCVMPHHQGIYTCSGTSGVKTKTSSPITVLIEESESPLGCQVNLPKIPRIVTWGPTILEIIDRDVTLPCNAIGSPEPEIYWINNKNQIINSEIVSPHYKILDNGDLFINRISWEDMGTYTCIADNALGQDKVESFVYPVKKDE